MNLPHPSQVSPFFLHGSVGSLFAVYYAPPHGVEELTSIVVAPAFAEEMNRCRAMVARQARALANEGIGTLVLDPYGTGDSEGDFVEGNWDTWKEDLRTGIGWLRSEGHACTALWGIRLGALMAYELAQHDESVRSLLFWQPVTSGKGFLTQFLRIRIAAEIGEAEGARTTDELRERFAAGSSVEVSGYEISARLGLDLDAKSFASIPSRGGLNIDWVEVPASESTVLSKAGATAVAVCREGGNAVRTIQIPGPPFWQLHERTMVSDLIDATTSLVTGQAPT
jgi:exosortase A-associated hydrolase 2